MAVGAALLAFSATTPALPFREQLRQAARFKDGQRAADLTFTTFDTNQREHQHVLKPADVQLSPKTG